MYIYQFYNWISAAQKEEQNKLIQSSIAIRMAVNAESKDFEKYIQNISTVENKQKPSYSKSNTDSIKNFIHNQESKIEEVNLNFGKLKLGSIFNKLFYIKHKSSDVDLIENQDFVIKGFNIHVKSNKFQENDVFIIKYSAPRTKNGK